MNGSSLRRVLAGALVMLLPMSGRAHPHPLPAVPADLEVPSGHRPFLVGHATGTQNYVCLPSATAPGVAWTLFGPQATLFADSNRQIATHFLSPNPEEDGTPRATWYHSQDSSAVWAVRAAQSSDPDFVAPDAIPWFLLQVVGSQEGPGGGRKLTETTWLQRINTAGGRAPASGCAEPGDVGRSALVPYAADYVFYKRRP